jgi:hypothetical protein
MLRDDSNRKRRLDSEVHYQYQLLDATNFSYSTLPTSAILRYQLQLFYATNFSYSTLPTSATLRYQLQLLYNTNFSYSTLPTPAALRYQYQRQLLYAANFSYSTLPTSATLRYKSFNKNIFVCFCNKNPPCRKILLCFLTFIMAAGKEQRTKLH